MKNQGVKIVLLVVLFLTIVLLGVYWALKPVITKPKTYELPGQTLPTVWAMDAKERTKVALRGYRSKKDMVQVCTNVIPVGTDGLISYQITEKEAVTKIHYTVRSVKDQALIENSEVTYEAKDGEIALSLRLTNLLNQGEEYYVDLVLATASNEEIHHYTRIYVGDDEMIYKLSEFAKEFSEATFDKTLAQTLLPIYIQTDGSMGSTNYGYVNIHSPYKMLTYGTMNPTFVTERDMKFSEVEENQVTMSFSYVLQIADGGEEELYDVVENFVVRYRNERFFLLDYNRTMDQEFVVSRAVHQNRVEIGISSDVSGRYTFDASTKGDILCFVADGILYNYQIAEGNVTEVFGFSQRVSNTDDRMLYGDVGHDIRILNIFEDGSMDFLVYGYMEQGHHEGEDGIAFYHYDAEKHTIEEQFFVASDLPYTILKEGVGTNAYVNENNVCYLVYGNSIYAIVLDGTEYYQVTDQLVTGHSAVSLDGSLIAWEQETKDGLVKNILCLDTKTGETLLLSLDDAFRSIPSDVRMTMNKENCGFKVLGFIDNDLIYGIYQKDDVYTDDGINVRYPMMCLNIVDGITGSLTGTYCYQDVYVTDIAIESTRICLTRVSYFNRFFDLEDDYILLNTSLAETQQVEQRVAIKSKTSEVLLTEYYLQNVNTQLAKDTLNYQSVRYLGSELRVLETEGVDFDGDWYVSGQGQLIGIESNLANAVNLANECYGTVRGRDGNVYWAMTPKAAKVTLPLTVEKDRSCSARANMMSMVLSGRLSPLACENRLKEESMHTIMTDAALGTYAELYGCPLSTMNYYLNRGNLVGAILLDNSTCVITGYDSEGYTLYMIEQEEERVLSTKEAAQYFQNNKNRFVTIIQ